MVFLVLKESHGIFSESVPFTSYKNPEKVQPSACAFNPYPGVLPQIFPSNQTGRTREFFELKVLLQILLVAVSKLDLPNPQNLV